MEIQKALNMLAVIAACGVVLVCCRDARAWPVPDTGQTKCYDNATEITCPQPGQPYYGQDGTYSINAPSYTKLDAGGADLPDSAPNWAMVRDEVTGLVWEEKHNLGGGANYTDPNNADNMYTWYDNNTATNGGTAGTPGDGTDTLDFINALNAINYGNHNDWRLPTRAELQSIVNYSHYDPAIDTLFFLDTQSFQYWSSSPGLTVYAWFVDFDEGIVSTQGKDGVAYVRAVRGGKSSNNFIDNSDGTVTDINTGLMWQQATALGTYTWKQALAYCDNMNLAGHTDWRLPTSKELHSIVDNSHYDPAIDTVFFPDTQASPYWSSGTYATSPGNAWDVDFYGGYVNNNHGKAFQGHVRSVRLGQVVTSTTTIITESTTTTIIGSTTSTTIQPTSTTTIVATTTTQPTTTTTVTRQACPATTALGADNPKLENLRNFRDSKLAQSVIGRKVIQIYYTNAGSINAALESSPALRDTTRKVLEVIAPVVGDKE